jgi:hypothetical protein
MFKFNFGNKKPTIVKYAIVGVVLSLSISTLSRCTHINENVAWDLLDEIQRKYFPQTIVNDFIIKNPEILKRRIGRDVNKAILNVTPEYDRIIKEADKKYQPKYMDLSNDDSVCYSEECRKLLPPMRICAPWVENCN